MLPKTSPAVYIGLLSILSLCIRYGTAIKCYHCGSEEIESCNDPFVRPEVDESSTEEATKETTTEMEIRPPAAIEVETASILIDCDTLNSEDGDSSKETVTVLENGISVDPYRTKKYTFCRKTVQTVRRGNKTTTRATRSCGYIADPELAPKEGEDPSELRCQRHTGSVGNVKILNCACYTDACNPASGISPISGIVLSSLVVVARILTIKLATV